MFDWAEQANVGDLYACACVICLAHSVTAVAHLQVQGNAEVQERSHIVSGHIET